MNQYWLVSAFPAAFLLIWYGSSDTGSHKKLNETKKYKNEANK